MKSGALNFSVGVGVLLAISASANAQQQAAPLIIDYSRPDTSLRAAASRADLIAVVRITNRHYRITEVMPLTDFEAQVIDVLGNPGGLPVKSPLSIRRHGGLKTKKGVQYLQEELGFPAWPLGVKLVAFLGWSDEQQVFYPISGPEFAFEHGASGKVRSHGRGPVAGSLRGRPFNELVDIIRAAIR